MQNKADKTGKLPAGRLRSLAIQILTRVEAGGYASRLLDGARSRHSLMPSDYALLTELVYGVLRFRGYLNYLITPFLEKPLAKLQPQVRSALRVGLYQLTHLGTPDYAAINETVQAIKSSAQQATGLVNAVLRRLAKEWFTISWPDFTTDPLDYISAFHSHPRWLVETWAEEMGIERTKELCSANNQPAPLTIRANSSKVTADDLIKLLDQAGITAQKVDGLASAVTVSSTASELAGSELFKEGYFYFQDASAMLAGQSLCNGEIPKIIYEPCAGLGGKATHLAELFAHSLIIASDRNHAKLALLRENKHRLGLDNIVAVCGDGLAPALLSADKILLDVPCSNLGVLRRHPEVKWRLKPEDLLKMAELQRALLTVSAELLASGGELVYSTCSITRVENWGVVGHFLSESREFIVVDPRERLSQLFQLYPDLSWDEGITIMPGQLGGDGAYLCLLRRK
jgi:16S rRNA (cytosine967-C5)-methyltransferase